MKTKILKHIAVALAAASMMTSHAADVLGVKGEQHSSFAFYVKDLRSGKVTFESDADRALVPASILKSVTSASALTLLGKDYRFVTPVYFKGDADWESGKWTGALTVVGVGDPTLDSENFDNNGGFCDSIVANLKRLGVKKISGSLDVVDNMTETGPVDQWEIDDVAWSYGAGLFGFNYCDNIFRLWPATGVTKPEVPGLNVIRISDTDGTNLERGIYSNNLVVTSNRLRDAKYSVASTMPDPASVFVAELKKKLADNDIKFVEAKHKRNSDMDSVGIYERTSPRLDTILRSLMERSDNMYAEGMLRALAPGKSRSAAIAVEKKLLDSLGITTDFVTIRDGSGLARVDRVSARFMGEMLEKMSAGANGDCYRWLFPVAGVSGTMKNFMGDTKLKGRLAFKTGSMNGVQCYAGYVLDRDGKPTHVAVIMANSFFCTRGELRDAIKTFLLNQFGVDD
jgi:D-alanyl-D-alanine carboxypeptidase/D-alanyl-D-alanine-endopeptidase (penicillin-binding protein 4)